MTIFFKKKIHFLIFFIFLCGFSADDKSSQIIIDGNSADFSSDEIILSPDLSGSHYESLNDSKWGENNDINYFKITWDTNYLYIAIDGKIENNNCIIYIDTGKGQGIKSVKNLPYWKRNFNFYEILPDFFIAVEDKKPTPEVWKILSNTLAEQLKDPGIKTKSSFHGTTKGSMEIRIPWDSFYQLGFGKVKPNSVLKIVAVVTGGDNSGGPDSMPNNTEGMESDWKAEILIDNFIILYVDKNGDSKPDIGINIYEASEIFVNLEKIKYDPLQINNLNLQTGVISPNFDGLNDRLTVSYYLTHSAKVTAIIFDIKGNLIKKLQENIELTAGIQSLSWDCADSENKIVGAGVYILYIKAETYGMKVVRKIAFAVVK